MELPHILRRPGLPDEYLEGDLAENLDYLKGFGTFAVHTVNGTYIDELWPHVVNGPVMGYNERHLLPFISDPFGQLQGGVVISQGRLIHMPSAVPLEHQRDRYLWDYAQADVYTAHSAVGVVKAFHRTMPLYRLRGDRNVYSPADESKLVEDVLEKITLDDLVSP